MIDDRIIIAIVTFITSAGFLSFVGNWVMPKWKQRQEVAKAHAEEHGAEGSEIDNRAKEFKFYVDEIAFLKGQNVAQGSEINRLTNENQALRVEQISMHGQVNTLKANEASLTAKIEALQQEKAAMGQRISELTAQVEWLNHRVDTLSRRVAFGPSEADGPPRGGQQGQQIRDIEHG